MHKPYEPDGPVVDGRLEYAIQRLTHYLDLMREASELQDSLFGQPQAKIESEPFDDQAWSRSFGREVNPE